MRRRQPPPADGDDLSGAFAELAEQHERATRVRRRLRWPAWLDRRIVIVLGIAVLALISDGVRRENREFLATLGAVSGSVTIQRPGAAAEPAGAGRVLSSGDIVATGPGAQATVRYPDGSVLTLGGSTTLEVRLIEYSRGGDWRDRSVALRAGQCWTAVGPGFGSGSELKVHTPSVVAAVRGTTISVAHDAASRVSRVCCSDGEAQVSGRIGSVSLGAGTESSAIAGGPPAMPAAIGQDAAGEFARHSELLVPPARNPVLRRVESRLNSLLDPVLTVLGIGRCSWGVGSSNSARRTAALESMRQIYTALQSFSTFPETLDPTMLEELGLSANVAERTVANFRGNAIDSYVCDEAASTFTVAARAKDRASTPVVATTAGVRLGTP